MLPATADAEGFAQAQILPLQTASRAAVGLPSGLTKARAAENRNLNYKPDGANHKSLRPLVLAEAQILALRALVVGPEVSPQMARRAQIVLLCAEYCNTALIARKAGVSKPTVLKWYRNFGRSGIASLYDIPTGRPRNRSAAQPTKQRGSVVYAGVRSIFDFAPEPDGGP